jgi:predicted nucleotidyltransferase
MKAPADVRSQLDGLVSGLTRILDGDLVGVYLHGSLVLGCFNPQQSDVDVIAVTKRSLTEEHRRLLGEVALGSSGPYERPRRYPYPLELSVLTEAQLRPWRYPTRFDFHYGESQRERFDAGEFQRAFPADHDFAAHITLLRKAGIALSGPAIADVFPAVPEADFADALMRDLAWSRQERLGLYAVLSASRVWATLAEGELHSKLSGSLWALDRAPEVFRPLIRRAVAVYSGEAEAAEFDLGRVAAYIDYVEPIASRYAAT